MKHFWTKEAKLLVFAIVLVFQFSTVVADDSECLTVVSQEMIDFENARLAAGWDYPDAPNYQVLPSIPITNHIIRRSNGTGGLTTAQLTQAMVDLNNAYAQVGLTFFQLGTVDYIDDDNWHNNSFITVASWDALRQINPTSNAIDVYFVPTLYGGLACGLSSFTSFTVQGIIMANACTGLSSNPSTFPHEVGHYFDAYHTHETTIGGQECPSGSNCSIAGDLICDTPADPRLSSRVSAYPGCTYCNCVAPPAGCDGTPYNPQTDNMMSYSRKQCRTFFSQGQIDKMIWTLQNKRTELLPSGQVIRVPQDQPTIQAGIDATSLCDTVLVSPGTYTGSGNTNLNFNGKFIFVISSGGASSTIIDCQNSARGFVFIGDNTEDQEVKGFTIRNGFSATGGGGIEIAGAQPNILDCVFESCSAPTGGAIRISSSNSINNPLIVGVTFITDTATSGDGGAIFVGDNASYIIGGCLFESNYATGRGGAIRIAGTGQNVRIDNTVFDANQSAGEGAAFSVDGTLTTFCNTFVNHVGTGGRPSVISIHGSAVVVLDRLNMTDNNTYAVDKVSGTSTLTFTCNNLWQNAGGNFNPSSVYQQSDVNTGSDLENIFLDPLYCDFANKDYRLSWLSPCDFSNNNCITSIGRFGAECGPAPDLLSPADNSSTTDQSPFMDWSDVDIASGVAQTYEIEIDNVEFFISPDRSASNLIVSNWTVSPNLPYGNWFWRVRAINTNLRSSGLTEDIVGDWSVVRTFEVIPPPTNPSCPVLFTKNETGYVEENPLLTACEESGYRDIVTDYYQLRTSPKVNNDRVTFQLRELEDEITFLDNIQLLTIDHSVTTKVACDVNGNIFCYKGEQAVALSAIDQNGNDWLSEVVDEDGILFNSTKSGSLTLTFPNNGQTGGYEFNAIPKQPQFCPPDEPFFRPVTVDELEIPILKIEVLNQDGSWAEIQAVPSRINPVSEIVLIALPESYASEIVTIRLSWEGSYSTDVVRQLIPIDENPLVKAIPIADYKLSIVDKGSGKWSGFGEDTPLILRKGDIFEFSFQVDELTGAELTRDFVIVATGRYEPDYEVYSHLLPNTVTLHSNYPNPFNPTTTISYSLPGASHVKLEIYNSLGQLVKTMVDGHKSAGHHQVEWKSLDNNGAGVASGVYFYRLVTDDFNESKKMMLLK